MFKTPAKPCQSAINKVLSLSLKTINLLKNEEPMEYIIIGISTLIGGFFAGAYLLGEKNFFDFDKKVNQAKELLEKSKKEAEDVLNKTKEREKSGREYMEQDIKRREARIEKLKENLNLKEKIAFKKEDKANEIRLKIASLKEETQSEKASAERAEKEAFAKLISKTGLSPESTKKEVLNKYQKELEIQTRESLAKIEEDLKENSIKTARKILINIIQRLCSPTSVETKAVNIKVPKDQIKGKIVGREGKNIEFFEEKLQVDVIFNDLPNTISLSAFNLVNRRIAQRAIEQLIKERGDIDKNVIQKAIKEAEKEVDKELYEIGEKAVVSLGLTIKDDDLIRTIGRLHFRTSYGQNIMKHSMEVAWIATMLGSELGLNTQICKIAGFLHDLGKAIDQDPNVQGAHDFLTKELMEKYKFSPEEVHAAWTHHDSEKQKTPEALIIKAADAVSAGRPGARQESLAKYLERIKALEETARSFDGVKTTYAISAGREIRIIVDPEKILDKALQQLAKNVAKEIENKLSFPGKIKVNAIRRMDQIEIAK